MNHNKARLLLQETENILINYNNQLQAGEMIDMQILENATSNFCKLIQEMSVEEAVIYRKSIIGLSESLKSLEQIITMRRDQTKEQIVALNNNANANKAYTS